MCCETFFTVWTFLDLLQGLAARGPMYLSPTCSGYHRWTTGSPGRLAGGQNSSNSARGTFRRGGPQYTFTRTGIGQRLLSRTERGGPERTARGRGNCRRAEGMINNGHEEGKRHVWRIPSEEGGHRRVQLNNEHHPIGLFYRNSE